MIELLKRILAVVVMGGLTGLLSAFVATCFVEVISRTDSFFVDQIGFGGFTLTVTLLVGGGLLVGLIRSWAEPQPMQSAANAVAAGQGLPDLQPATGFKSALAALVSLCSGASVGQYGPLVHLGGLIGSLVEPLVKSRSEARPIAIACGVAAAIATVFNAPLTGILFAHEVILRHYSLRAFAPVTVAATLGFVVSSHWLGHHAIFAQDQAVVVVAEEYLLFVVMGVVGGLLAVLLMHAVRWSGLLADRTPIPDWLRPAAGGAVLALLAIWVPEVLGTGIPVLKLALSENYALLVLITVLVAKIFATAMCLGFGFVGGILSPSLLIGVLFGAIIRSVVEQMLPGQHSDLIIYAACGMVAVVSPVIGAPITAILLVLELTQNYEITTAAMICVAFSNLVSYRVYGRSYFDQQLLLRGFDLKLGREKLILSMHTVGEHIRHDFQYVAPDDLLDQCQVSLSMARASRAIVMQDESVMGMVELPDIISARQACEHIRDMPIQALKQIPASTTLWQAVHLFKEAQSDCFAVCDDEDGRFLGMILRIDIGLAYREIVESLHQEQHAPA